MSHGGAARRRVDAAHRLRTVLLVLLALNAVAAWAEILGVYTLGERAWHSLRDRVIAHPIETHLLQLEVVRRLHGLVWLATVPVFLLWIRRVHWNVTAFAPVAPAFSARAAVSAFFVPLVNLVVPVRIVRALWVGSAPDDAPPSAATRSPLVPCWWALVIVAAVLDPFWSRVWGAVDELALGGPTLLLILAQLAEIAAAVLGIVIVYSIDALQMERWGGDGEEPN